jgi:hypothetical protein
MPNPRFADGTLLTIFKLSSCQYMIYDLVAALICTPTALEFLRAPEHGARAAVRLDSDYPRKLLLQ